MQRLKRCLQRVCNNAGKCFFPKLSEEREQLNCVFSTVALRPKPSRVKSRAGETGWGGRTAAGVNWRVSFNTCLYFPIFLFSVMAWLAYHRKQPKLTVLCFFSKEENTLGGKAGPMAQGAILLATEATLRLRLRVDRSGYETRSGGNPGP